MTGATIDVQRPPAGWSHLSGPGLHVLVALEPDDGRHAAAAAAVGGGDLDDVIDALAAHGPRRAPAFVAVHLDGRPRVVTHGAGYAVLTSPRGTLEVRAPHDRVWSDLMAEPDVDTVALRVQPAPAGSAAAANPASAAPPAPAPTPRAPGDADRTVDRSSLLSAPRDLAGPTVLAVLCPSGHPSPPERSDCRVCGKPVPAQEPFVTARPMLGVLRLSTGDLVTLDRGVLLGRTPQPPPGLGAAEQPHVVRLSSPQRDISRNHLQVLLEGWRVLVRDLDTTNGTTVTRPGQAPERLRAHEAQVIEAGTVVSLADEVTFVLEAAP